MTENPVTPAQAATPGAIEQGVQNPSVVASQSPASPEEKVTISLKEYRDLQRSHARQLSFEKRKDFLKKAPVADQGDGTSQDPELVQQLNRERELRETAEKRAMQSEVRDGVRGILSKPEYAGLPESTKNLILKNPSALSDADNIEEALLDIEDFVRENSVSVSKPGDGSTRPEPAHHDTPQSVSTGTPAPVYNTDIEDTSRLTGVNRSRAILRNTMRKARGIKVN